MCGRMVLTRSAREIADAFELEAVLELEPRYNIAPSQPIAAIRAHPEAGRHLSLLHWGLIPSWARDRSVGHRMINARSETAAEKPSFRDALRRRRCIVPADGFYEWLARSKGDRGAHFFRRPDGALLAIAGLWEQWRDQQRDEVIESCTLLTTEANAVVRPVHDRMPVLLERNDIRAWLDPEQTHAERVQSLLVPSAPDRLEGIPVGTYVNNPRNDDPACIAPL